MLNSVSFCSSVKLLIAPLNLSEGLTGYSIPDCRFFPLITLNISCHYFLAYRICVEKWPLTVWGFPWMLLGAFSLAAYISSLCLISISLITICLSMFLLGFIMYGTLWTWVNISSPILGKFSTIMSSKISQNFSFSLLLESL